MDEEDELFGQSVIRPQTLCGGFQSLCYSILVQLV